MTYKLVALGKDNKIHCCCVDNKSISCCEDNVSIKQVNPHFYKLSDITWCYECSSLLENQEVGNE